MVMVKEKKNWNNSQKLLICWGELLSNDEEWNGLLIVTREDKRGAGQDSLAHGR